MTMQNSRHSEKHRRRLSEAARTSAVPGTLADKHRAAWRRAISGFASPAVRLHRMRKLKAQILEEVLNGLDGCHGRDSRGRDG